MVAGLGVMATGCAEYRPEPLSAGANAADLEQRRLDDPLLHEFVRVARADESEAGRETNWNLTTLTLAAIYYHPDLDIARGRLALSRARVVTAGQRPNPVFDFSALFDSAAVAGAITPGAVPLTIGPVVKLLVETFGKREYRMAQAKRLGVAARWDLASAAWQVRGRVRAALLDLWAARHRITLAGTRLALQDELVRLLEKRLAAGDASALDLTRERINRARTAVAVSGFERAADQAEAELAAAIGVPARAVAGLALSLAAFEHAPKLAGGAEGGALRRRALTGRTDVEAALAQYEAAQSALQLQVANQYPNLTLGAGYNYDAGVNRFGISPTVDLPIFNQNQGQIAEAVARRQEAAANFTALQARIIGAIDTALAAYGAATRELNTADALLTGAERRQRDIVASFRAGQIDRPTRVAAELETAAIRLSRLDAAVAQRQAIGALEDALQHPLYGPATLFSVPQISPRPPAERQS